MVCQAGGDACRSELAGKDMILRSFVSSRASRKVRAAHGLDSIICSDLELRTTLHIASTCPNMANPTDKVLGTYELLEAILVHSSPRELFVLQRVSQTW